VRRRGEPWLAREVVRVALQLLLRDDDVPAAVEMVKAHAAALLRGDVDMSRLVATKALWRTDMSDIRESAASNDRDPVHRHTCVCICVHIYMYIFIHTHSCFLYLAFSERVFYYSTQAHM
jgi:hypothetical protein